MIKLNKDNVVDTRLVFLTEEQRKNFYRDKANANQAEIWELCEENCGPFGLPLYMKNVMACPRVVLRPLGESCYRTREQVFGTSHKYKR